MSPPRRRRSSSRGQRRSSGGRAFWGADDAPARDLPVVTPTEHPGALVESLGALPFPGGRVAQHYFDAVYERAAGLALALATAAGLTEEARADGTDDTDADEGAAASAEDAPEA